MANLVDNAIQQLFKDSCKVVKLWENASPTSAFQQQILPITGDYDQVIVNGYDEPTGVIITSLNQFSAISRIAQVGAATASWLAQRPVRYTGTGVVFDETDVKYADRPGPAEINNAYCVPYQIYGIKLLGGGNTQN